MARDTVNNCMFCGFNSCSCSSARKKPPQSSVRKSTRLPDAQENTGEVRSSEVDISTESARVRQNHRARSGFSSVERVKDPATEAEDIAITMFAEADMLHHSSLEELRPRIRLPKHRIDAMIWRQVNNDSVRRRR